jgi:flagellar protein FlaJ
MSSKTDNPEQIEGSKNSSNPFETSWIDRLKRAGTADTTAAAANALFGPIVDDNAETFEDLKEDLKQADIDVLYRTYVSEIFLFSSMVLILGAIAGLMYSAYNSFPVLQTLRYAVGVPLAATIVVFGGMYMYPGQKAKSRKKDIENNLPYAMNHLAAIATSGIPPSSMFELLSTFDEYGGISDEAEKVSRRVNTFGEDFTTALREVAERSPSEDWDEVLYGILSTVETGGNLENFLKEKADEALFEFKIDREKEIERLSTYASFYTAILIAAPVFLVTILSVMNLLGGTLLGFAIRDLMWMGVHILIPVLNVLFILFLGIKVN